MPNFCLQSFASKQTITLFCICILYYFYRTQLNCSFAVDFTASNGDPKSPSSLHYMNPYRPNSYQTALRSVGEIIKDYDR